MRKVNVRREFCPTIKKSYKSNRSASAIYRVRAMTSFVDLSSRHHIGPEETIGDYWRMIIASLMGQVCNAKDHAPGTTFRIWTSRTHG
jgi:hypothetical protein